MGCAPSKSKGFHHGDASPLDVALNIFVVEGRVSTDVEFPPYNHGFPLYLCFSTAFGAPLNVPGQTFSPTVRVALAATTDQIYAAVCSAFDADVAKATVEVNTGSSKNGHGVRVRKNVDRI